MKRKATSIWKGKGIDGKGSMSTASGTVKNAYFDSKTRFGEDKGTNPEELIAAAHSGCFVMQLSFNIQEAGFVADELNAECSIAVKDFHVQGSHITLNAKVPGIDAVKFEELVRNAEKNCPISKLLDTPISVDFTLN